MGFVTCDPENQFVIFYCLFVCYKGLGNRRSVLRVHIFVANVQVDSVYCVL